MASTAAASKAVYAICMHYSGIKSLPCGLLKQVVKLKDEQIFQLQSGPSADQGSINLPPLNKALTCATLFPSACYGNPV